MLCFYQKYIKVVGITNSYLVWSVIQMIIPSNCMSCLNSLKPSDAIWRQRSGSTLVQVMACCLTAPSHYLNLCWLIISNGQLHYSDGNFTRDTSVISDQNWHENYSSKMSLKSPRGQWVKLAWIVHHPNFEVLAKFYTLSQSPWTVLMAIKLPTDTAVHGTVYQSILEEFAEFAATTWNQ